MFFKILYVCMQSELSPEEKQKKADELVARAVSI